MLIFIINLTIIKNKDIINSIVKKFKLLKGMIIIWTEKENLYYLL